VSHVSEALVKRLADVSIAQYQSYQLNEKGSSIGIDKAQVICGLSSFSRLRVPQKLVLGGLNPQGSKTLSVDHGSDHKHRRRLFPHFFQYHKGVLLIKVMLSGNYFIR
jgi:hypothetical protein